MSQEKAKFLLQELDVIEESDLRIFEEIEQIRNEIKEKRISLKYIDYGAREPNLTLTQNEMYEGIEKLTSTEKLCQIGLKGIWAQLIYGLVKKYKPSIILELGTCCGFSAIYMSKAYPESIIYTIEGDSNIAEIAKLNIKKANCKNVTVITGRFQDILDEILEELKHIDFAFVDGHHDKYATIRYFNLIKKYMSAHSLMIFDDISWSEGMKQAWQEISKNSAIKKNINLEKVGICFL